MDDFAEQPTSGLQISPPWRLLSIYIAEHHIVRMNMGGWSAHGNSRRGGKGLMTRSLATLAGTLVLMAGAVAMPENNST